MATGTTRPWYREPWLWFLAVPPLATVVFWTVILTTTAERPSLVMDDYSKVGLTMEQTRARDATASRLGLSGRLHVQRDGGRVAVALVGLEELPQQLKLRLAHPTDARRDVTVELNRDEAGLYRAEIRQLAAGRRYVQLEPLNRDWRLAGELSHGGEELELTPPPASGS
ncbi:FixH family protein [Ectothiorhodospiraceae bacterium WFHF3C12]|nr:FixH family protein [Ectothiorhodospiraceae bacterium WFHF3C12]